MMDSRVAFYEYGEKCHTYSYISPFASLIVLYFFLSHSDFILPQKLSIGALSQQSPLRLMLHMKPCLLSILLYSFEQ